MESNSDIYGNSGPDVAYQNAKMEAAWASHLFQLAGINRRAIQADPACTREQLNNAQSVELYASVQDDKAWAVFKEIQDRHLGV